MGAFEFAGKTVLVTGGSTGIGNAAARRFLAAPVPAGGLHWSIPDPVRIGDAAAFDAAFDELDQRITHLATHLTAV